MMQILRLLTVLMAFVVLALPGVIAAQTTTVIPPELITPDRVQTRIGTLEFKDGAPSVDTAQKVYDTLDFVRGVNVYKTIAFAAPRRMRFARAFSASGPRTTRWSSSPN